jgi:Activator of Hsp90 ATPase homolog 1-like protein
MKQSYSTTFLVDQSPKEAFDAVNNVRGWWSGDIDGNTDKLGEEFTYRYKDIHYSRQKVIEVVPDEKVVWDVLDAHLSFAQDKTDWNGTKVIFEIARKGEKTEVRFTHQAWFPNSNASKTAQARGAFV